MIETVISAFDYSFFNSSRICLEWNNASYETLLVHMDFTVTKDTCILAFAIKVSEEGERREKNWDQNFSLTSR